MVAPVEGQQLAPRRGRPFLLAAPVVIFAGVAALFYVGLFSIDQSKIPSVLIDKSVPVFTLKPLGELVNKGQPVPGFSGADLAGGEVSLVNVWASWCVPCRQEHPYLMNLAGAGQVRMYGMNYKDKTANARRFLGQLGNPYQAVGVDDRGRVAIDWGVYGIPETFIVDGAGVIRYKQIGPLNPRSYAKLRDMIAKIAAEGATAARPADRSGG